ncbi:MAG TPA: histidinol-phosphate transaminase [Chloroflexia bacterium]|nr:histidinol-phosphate transaminase [Chloroflexia bacterium]
MIRNLIRPIIHNFEPYQWELSTVEVAWRYGLTPAEVIRFDTNTSPFLPYRFMNDLLENGQKIPAINEYGDASYAGLREDLAAYHNCRPEQVVIGAGADELIDMVAKLFLNNGDRALINGPTYPVYAIATELMGGQLIDVPRGGPPNFSVDVEQVLATTIEQAAKLIWLCNPNNPTATAVPLEAIEWLLEKLNGRAALAIDEAYAEFWGKTTVPLVAKYPNLLVIRTFSKAFSLAGARVGCVIAQPETAFYLNQVRPPNSVSNLSVTFAREALQPAAVAEMRKRVEFILEEKKRFVSLLERHCEAVYPSVANFVLARMGTAEKAEQIAEKLLEKGFVVRRPGTMPGHFRLTVRLPEENNRLLEAL